MNKLYVYAGIAASVVMIGIGIGSIVVGASGRDEVRDKIQREDRRDAGHESGRHARPWRRQTSTPKSRTAPSPMKRSTMATARSASRSTCGSTRWRTRTARRTPRCRGSSARTASRRRRSPRPRSIRSRAGRREPRAEHLGHGDRPLDRPQHVVFRGAGGELLDRDGHLPAARGYRLPGPYAPSAVARRPRAETARGGADRCAVAGAFQARADGGAVVGPPRDDRARAGHDRRARHLEHQLDRAGGRGGRAPAVARRVRARRRVRLPLERDRRQPGLLRADQANPQPPPRRRRGRWLPRPSGARGLRGGQRENARELTREVRAATSSCCTTRRPPGSCVRCLTSGRA